MEAVIKPTCVTMMNAFSVTLIQSKPQSGS